MVNEKRKFSKIYDRYIDSIYRFIFIKVSSSETAEDLTSEVFLKSWEKYRQKKDIKNPRAYIYKIARNLVIDFYRERGQTTIVSIEEKKIEIKSDEDIEKERQEKESLNNIKKGLAKLKPEYQDIVIFRYVEGLPLRDIAKIMDKSYGSTRVMLHRAMKELKKII
jgi:RNA polymerase sigma-70 factor, ECF subfamily